MTAQTQPTSQSGGARSKPLSLLTAAAWLAVLLIVAKAITPALPSLSDLPRRLLTFVMATWSDVLFALICGALGEIGLFVAQRSRRARAIVYYAFLVVFAVFAAYSVAAVGLFRYFNRPLTFDLLGMIGNAGAVRSSIAERLTPVIAIALVAVPAAFVALAMRFGRSNRKSFIMLATLSIWAVAGCIAYRIWWDEGQLTHLWRSPHAELIRTTAIRLTGGRRPGFPKDFPPEFLDEFRTFGARATNDRARFSLPPGTAHPKNVIVIVLESVGTKYLGLYGNPIDVTPTITAESRQALVFDNIYAHASFTYASFRPIVFSTYPGLPWHYSLLEDARAVPPTLASLLKARGSRTAYITSGDLDWGDQRWLLQQHGGFDLLQGASDLGCPLLSSWGTEDRCAVDRLLAWIDEKPDQPFAAVWWTDQTHDPYLPVSRSSTTDYFAGKSRPPFAADLSRYLNNLRDTDAQLARIFAALRERGIADDTVVVITGDHGEAFADPHPQRGHAWSVYEEEVRVPLMIWNPRLFEEAARAQTIGGHIDLNPTLADLLEVEPPRDWQGHSLFDLGRPSRAYFMAIAGGDVFGVREANLKYIYDVTSGGESLFDLAADPQEQHDIAAREPERCRELRQRVAAWVTFEDAFLWGREN